MPPRESRFEQELVRDIEKKLPGSIILKIDGNTLQGFADRLILYGPYWAILEIKVSKTAHRQPNQTYYVELANEMGAYGSFVYPENREEILDELQRALRS